VIGYNENSLITNAFGGTNVFVINEFNCILKPKDTMMKSLIARDMNINSILTSENNKKSKILHDSVNKN